MYVSRSDMPDTKTQEIVAAGCVQMGDEPGVRAAETCNLVLETAQGMKMQAVPRQRD